MIQIRTLDAAGEFSTYAARPEGEPKAAIIVIQEIFGVNEGIRRKCDHWAGLGYLALAPDLFWRIKPGVELDPDIDREFKEALDLMGRFDQAQGVRDIEACIREARILLGGKGKVGCVGYCLGGRLAFMTAARTDIDASVSYYGVGLDNLMREKHAISRPLMLHIACEDHFVPKDVQAKIHEELDRHPKAAIHDYPGQDHGFAAEIGKRRNDEAARLSDQRTETFFAEHLS